MNSDADDLELLRRARALDAVALTQLYDAHSAGVQRYAMRLVGDARLAEDCVTETFSRLLAALRNGQGPTSALRAYLFRVAHNWLMDEHRSFRRQPEMLPLQDDLDAVASSNSDDDLLQVASDTIRRERLRTAIGSLTLEQQQVVSLRFLEGWSLEETAQVVGKPVGAVKALQHRAIAAVKRVIGNDDGI
jgi:RNA polymerase sigma-70 factor (ECF subfamily)